MMIRQTKHHSPQIGSIRALRGVFLAIGFLACTARAQVLTNFPPSWELTQIQLRLERADAGGMRLRWNTVPVAPASYIVVYRTNLADAHWKPASDWIHPVSETTSVEIAPAEANSAFYRVEASGVWEALQGRYRQNLFTYDGDDYYFVARRDADGNIIAYNQEVHLRRIFRLVHVRFNTDVGTNFVTASGFTLNPVTVRMGPAMALWRIMEDPVFVGNAMVAWGRSNTVEKVLAELRADDRAAFAFPAYIGEGGGNPLVADVQLIVELKDGVSISELSDFLAQQGVSAGGRAGPGPPNGPNQYYVFLGNPKDQDPFVTSLKLTADLRVVWAVPNFLGDGCLNGTMWDYVNNIDSGCRE